MNRCGSYNFVSRLIYFLVITALLCRAHAGDIVFPPGGESACEADWMTRQPFNSLPAESILKFTELAAKRGQIAAQLRLGMVYKTLDGKWTTPEDYSYNIQWLEKAIQKGSKSAAAQLAIIQYTLLKPRTIDHRAYITALIPAVLEEHNPWVATTLMDLTRRRWGKGSDGYGCLRGEKPEACNGGDLLPRSDTRQWAEIAAEGGNPNAQQWLCLAASDGEKADFGQRIDRKAAFKWCLIASHNACDLWSPSKLSSFYMSGVETKQDEATAKRWLEVQQQPWRGDGQHLFFSPLK